MASNLIDAVYYGTQDDLDSASYSERVEFVEMNNGLKVVRHVKTKMINLERVSSLCDTWGIGPSNAGGLSQPDRNSIGEIITSASYEMTEVVSDLCLDTNPAFLPDSGSVPDGTKIITFYKNMIWIGVDETINIEFKYRGVDKPDMDPIVAKMLKSGHKLNDEFCIGPAISTVYPKPATEPRWPYIYYPGSIADANLRFIIGDTERRQQEDWHTASTTMTRRVPNDNTGESPLKSLLKLFNSPASNALTGAASINMHGTTWLGFDLNRNTLADGADGFYKLTIRFELSDSASAKLTESIEWYPSDPTSPVFDIT